ncbi:MAG TPA: prepilin-type N-terminal cleavage/methylation domain-containing protein [Phycisphaerae bacterium]|nr:prepilin-type N-terminal cleavage/methylation domain-containing protein [Phycisphaerales bacterium]HRX84935.1 prepilin-type N-terminal cleavage/methylation domain-containing protein [Phycisphaerae bacterium]
MRRDAFSLVELVAVLVILALVSALAAPRIAGALARQRADSAARRVVADISLAQRTARATSAARSVAFDLTNECYTLADIDDPDRPGQTYTVKIMGEPYRTELVSARFGLGLTLSFDGFGRPADGGKLIIRTGDACRQITVDGTTGATEVSTVACPARAASGAGKLDGATEVIPAL